MRKLTLIAIAVMFAFVAADAYASVQNIKISGSVDSTYLYRRNFDFHLGSGDDRDQNAFITQTTLQVDADLTDQVAATIGLINERVWDADSADANDDYEVDIYLAYVTLREMLYSPLTLVIGRQDFRYGNSLIMDSAGANNVAPLESGIAGVANDLTKQTTLDAIRAILDYNPLTVEIVYSQIDSGTVTNADNDDAAYLTGFNATYELGDDLDSVIEGYFWKRVDKTNSSGTANAKADVIKVVGGRFSTNPLEAISLHGEYAMQWGNRFDTNASAGDPGMNRTRKAFAVQGIVNYQIPVMEEYKPVGQYAYTKVSGADDTGTENDSDWNGWDPFFENQGGGTIYNTLFNLTNLQIHTMSLQVQPLEDVTAKLSGHVLFTERNNKPVAAELLVQPDSSSPTVYVKDVNSWLGKELDLDLTYDYTEDVQFGLNVGWYFPGSHYLPQNDSVAKQVLANLNVAF